MTQTLEVVQRPQFAGLGYTEGECSNMSEDSKTLLKLLRKDNYGNTSPSSHDGAPCRGRAKASSHHQNCTKDSKERYKQSQYSRVHFDYKDVFNDEHKSWHRNYVVFVVYITM